MNAFRFATLSLTLLVVAMGLLWWAARPVTPDALFDLSADSRPPGTLLRDEPFTTGVPAGARARLILYATTRGDGQAAVGSAIVVIPAGRSDRPRPVIAWAHGTTGIDRGCAPSMSSKPFDNLPGLDALLEQGWAVVATDYVGLGTRGPHAYLSGEDASRGFLDALRAAMATSAFGLSREAVFWGHSQGGHATLFAAMRAPEYAPEIALRGVVAMAPASDLVALIGRAQSSMFGKIVSSYVIKAYASIYPDILPDDYVAPAVRLVIDDIASRCVGGWQTLVSVGQTLLLPGSGIFKADPTSGPLGTRLRQNIPALPIASPVLIAQGDQDDLVFPDVQRAYVTSRCSAGQVIDYRVYPGLDHISLVAHASPLTSAAIKWTADRFAERPVPQTCN